MCIKVNIHSYFLVASKITLKFNHFVCDRKVNFSIELLLYIVRFVIVSILI